jgi:hypothetical protein
VTRRYTRKERLTAVIASDMTSTLAASEATGIPRTTIIEWRNKPEFDLLRQNAREAMVDEAVIVARLAWQKLGDAIRDDRLEPRDLVMAAGMATDKSQLLTGSATSRTESRDITGTISDAELASAIREAESLTTGRRGPEAVEEPAAD